ncbi:SDR family oxidoreductase [Candidatus Woesearchaeota archaeon]|nr:SDR family oxidoreductase [Candidatus Woesearchaeota archaeon]
MGKILITGATGLLGRMLVSALGRENAVLLVREPKCLEKFPELVSKEAIQGDILHDGLGIAKIKKEEIIEIWHLAANTNLSGMPSERDEIFLTNVHGTKNILEFARGCKNLKKYYHMSTAYAAGKQEGPIAQDWIPRPYAFRNSYEESKWEGENIVRKYTDRYRIPYVIFRPGILAFDTKQFSDLSGQTFYRFTSILLDSIRGHDSGNLRLVGKDIPILNIVWAEKIIDAALAIRKTGKINSIYNLTSQVNVSVGDILSAVEELTGRRINAIALPQDDFSIAEKNLNRKISVFHPYMSGTSCKWEGEKIFSCGLTSIEFTEHLTGYIGTCYDTRHIIKVQ